MKLKKHLLLTLLILMPFFAHSQKWAYLQKDSGRLKKLKSKTVYHFQAKDSSWYAGRIMWVTDSTLILKNARKYAGQKQIELKLSDIIKIQNPLMHNEGLKEMAGWMIAGSTLFVVMIPIVWIDEGWDQVQELFGVWGGVLGVAGVLMTPYLFKRTFNFNKWAIVAK
jgi:hypothetical protein